MVDTLVAAGVKRIYGLVGDSLNGVTDSSSLDAWVKIGHFDLIGDYLSERVRPPEFGQDQFDEVLVRLQIVF